MGATVITLLSGQGIGDASISIAKAALMQAAPGATIVDISHSVAQNDLQQAAYLLLSAYRYFPRGTIHVLPVDICATHRIVLLPKDGYFFIAPDNGVLSLAFEEGLNGSQLCYEFSAPFFFTDWIHRAGRAIAAVLENNTAVFSAFGTKTVPRLLQPKTTRDGIDCNILYVDRYENIVLDITEHQFKELVQERPFLIKLMRAEDITAISNNYCDVPQGKPLCRFNNAGFLEIAFNHGKAATALGFGIGDDKSMRYRTIKIFTPAF